MGSLDTRLHELEARVAAVEGHCPDCAACEGFMACQHIGEQHHQLLERVAALEACVDCDQVPPCPRPAPAQAASDAAYWEAITKRADAELRPKQAAQSRESDKTPAGVEPAPQQPCPDAHICSMDCCPRNAYHEQPRSGGGAL